MGQLGYEVNSMVLSSASLRKGHTILLLHWKVFSRKFSSNGRGRSSRTSGPRDSRLLLLRSWYLRLSRPSKAPASISEIKLCWRFKYSRLSRPLKDPDSIFEILLFRRSNRIQLARFRKALALISVTSLLLRNTSSTSSGMSSGISVKPRLIPL